MLRRIFYNDIEKRLRALWRLALQIVLLAAVSIPLILLVGMLAKSLGRLPEDLSFRAGLARLSQGSLAWSTLLFVVKALGVLLSLVLAARFLDRRRFRNLGLRLNRRWFEDLGFGFFLGALLMTVIFIFEWAAGWIKITSTFRSSGSIPFALSVLCMLAVFGLVGFYEEAFSRGYGLKNLAEGLHLPGVNAKQAVVFAWVLSSLFFGIGHGLNPHAGWISTLGVSVAGLLLGLGYVLTGELAISIGLHLSWNFFQGTVFGFSVSGRDFGVSLLGISQGGPELWTGGAFGPEAGLLGLLACLFGGLMVLLWVFVVYGSVHLRGDIAVYSRLK